MLGRRRLAASALLAVLVLGCATPDLAGAPAAQNPPPPVEVEVTGTELVLVHPGGDRRVVGRIDPDRDGELVHAAVRPGQGSSVTVLAVTRADDLDGRRYELRYLTADDTAATDLYWFPWRLQVDEELVATLDAVPVPVWAPDGSAVAWVEWDAGGTRLRTVRWRDEEGSSNPSDDAGAYELADVPAGTQLQAWEQGEDGVPILVGSDGATTWRIRIDTDHGVVALADRTA